MEKLQKHIYTTTMQYLISFYTFFLIPFISINYELIFKKKEVFCIIVDSPEKRMALKKSEKKRN
jgi:lipocalin